MFHDQWSAHWDLLLSMHTYNRCKICLIKMSEWLFSGVWVSTSSILGVLYIERMEQFKQHMLIMLILLCIAYRLYILYMHTRSSTIQYNFIVSNFQVVHTCTVVFIYLTTDCTDFLDGKSVCWYHHGIHKYIYK